MKQTIDRALAGRSHASRAAIQALLLAVPFISACSSAKVAAVPAATMWDGTTRGAEAAADSFAGSWNMATRMGDREIEAILTLERDGDGVLEGVWTSQGREMDLHAIHEDGTVIAFDREVGGSGQWLHFEGSVDGDSLSGVWSGALGELASSGRRAGVTEGASARVLDQHDRPLRREDGRTLLWAGGGEVTGESETDWFDLTGSAIDPELFQYGVGRDSIPSIDDPVFVSPDDDLLAQRGVDAETLVLGVFVEGVARAYPVDVMDVHEIVNDEFGDKSYAVLW